MKHFEDQIWAYLHHELSDEERERFEEALQNDPSLQTQLEEFRSLHQDLTDVGDLLLGEQLIHDWEAEHPEYKDQPKKENRRIIRFSLPIAAAAAVLFVFTIPFQHRGPIHWQRTAYGDAPRMRGQTAGEAQYSADRLKQMNEQLQDVIEFNLANKAPNAGKWTLKIHLQELANGYLSVEIYGHPRKDPKSTEFWSATFQKPDREIADFAQRVADGIAEIDAQ